MNYKKLILVGIISAFVAVLTSVLGVAGTVIGSVISSVLYNMLSEALEKPMASATFSTNFEWDIAYIFPLAVIALIQMSLIFALLSEYGLLPPTFLDAFLSLQHLANNNLYRILGVAMLIISTYPLIVKPDIIKKSYGAIIAFVGLIFLARGFVDAGTIITNLYDDFFIYFDLPIAFIALLLILYVIANVLISANQSEKEFKTAQHQINENDFNPSLNHDYNSSKPDDFNPKPKRSIPVRDRKPHYPARKVSFRNNVGNKKPDVGISDVGEEKPDAGINKSYDKIHFESNDLLDDYKK